MAALLKGGPVAAARMKKLSVRIEELRGKGIRPCLAIVRVGEREEDLSYERGAMKRAESLGIEVKRFLLPEEVSEEALLDTLQIVNEDDKIHGCLLFRPLPAHLDTERIANALRPEKDIDAMTTASMGGLLTRANIGFAPCTATACMEILHYYDIPIKGKKVAMIGKSAAVGLPTALLLMNEEATVSVCHILTDPEDTKRFCREANLIISAAGCRNLIRADYVREGQIIIDVGINITPEGKICGDVDFEQVEPLVAAITPVPGGVGAVTSTVMSGHVVEAAWRTLTEIV
ncbi:MAG: bifunctional 5,10-methylenetetrahydrofolate dehydrogenase/5,10-methenyltetrahydrofolate cyclohydrolase [Oscillospiraceae bacterium]